MENMDILTMKIPTPRTDAFTSDPMNWHYKGFCDGVDCERARASTAAFARSLERELAVARGALEALAEFDDVGASDYLARTGSYAYFDEPGSVKISRETLTRLDSMAKQT